MLTFLLFSFHRRRTRGPSKMIFCIYNYQSFVSVCAENNLGSVEYSQNYCPFLAWGLVIGLAEVFKKGALVRNSDFAGKRGNG